MSQGLGKYVCHLVVGRDYRGGDMPLLYHIPSVVTIYFNMLCSLMEHWVLAMNTIALLSHLITMGHLIGTFRSNRTDFTHISSVVVWAIALYLSSTLNSDTTCSFLLFHATRLPPTKVQNPVVDFLSAGLPALSRRVHLKIVLFETEDFCLV